MIKTNIDLLDDCCSLFYNQKSAPHSSSLSSPLLGEDVRKGHNRMSNMKKNQPTTIYEMSSLSKILMNNQNPIKLFNLILKTTFNAKGSCTCDERNIKSTMETITNNNQKKQIINIEKEKKFKNHHRRSSTSLINRFINNKNNNNIFWRRNPSSALSSSSSSTTTITRTSCTSTIFINLILLATTLLALSKVSFSSVSANGIQTHHRHYLQSSPLSSSSSSLSSLDASTQNHQPYSPMSPGQQYNHFMNVDDNDGTQPPNKDHHERMAFNTALKYNKMLNQLRLNREQHRRAHHNSQSRLTDPIFDPNFEELSLLDSNEQQQQQQQARAWAPIMVKQLNNNNLDKHHQHKSSMLAKINGTRKSFEDNMELGDNLVTDLTDDIVVGEQMAHEDMSMEDQENSVKKIISSGWIQHTSTKKLLYYLRKIDEVLFKDAAIDSDFVHPVDHGESLNPEEDEILTNKQDKTKRGDSLMRNNKNLEIMLNRIMSTPSVVKKRGEGPQLSIDYPLTVLRQRLIAELARRKAKETEQQIAINTEILKKLGRRRRRRSILSGRTPVNHMQTSQSNNLIDCDLANCNVQDVNLKRSNLYQSILGNIHGNNMEKMAKLQVKRNPFYKIVNQPQIKNRFRNNDKYFMFDRPETTSQTSNANQQQLNFDPESLLDMKNRVRINSKKPLFLAFEEPNNNIGKDLLMASIDNQQRFGTNSDVMRR